MTPHNDISELFPLTPHSTHHSDSHTKPFYILVAHL
jgi:hypothetical protein